MNFLSLFCIFALKKQINTYHYPSYLKVAIPYWLVRIIKKYEITQ